MGENLNFTMLIVDEEVDYSSPRIVFPDQGLESVVIGTKDVVGENAKVY